MVPTNKTPITKRRLKTKPALIVMALLLFGNLFWFVLWIFASTNNGNGGGEVVATVQGENITRQEWMYEMENLYGKETLHILINNVVMEKAAEKYGIKVSDQEIDLELALLMSSQDGTDTSIQKLEEEPLREKIRSQLILEKVLTKDILIEEDEKTGFFEQNKSFFNTSTTYKTSIIVVNNQEEADSVYKELINGSDFSALARERSTDTSSASLGGNIGYLTLDQTNIDSNILNVVQTLDEGEMSEPFPLSDGTYGLIYIAEISEGKSFTYEEVKDHIKRGLGMDQLPSSISPEAFWDEFNATSFYLN